MEFSPRLFENNKYVKKCIIVGSGFHARQCSGLCLCLYSCSRPANFATDQVIFRQSGSQLREASSARRAENGRDYV